MSSLEKILRGSLAYILVFHVSRHVDYGLLLVTALASPSHKSHWVSLRALANERRLPYPFLVKIVADLRKAGLVKAQEGFRGGYRLARLPSEISIQEVLRALGEPLILVPCGKDHHGCQSFCQCNSRELWHQVQKQIDDFLSNYSIAHLIGKSDSSEKPNVTFHRLIARVQ